MTEDYTRWIVTTDPAQVADLQAKAKELDTFGLAEYAMSIGLFPPGYTEGQHPSIEFASPPGHEGLPLIMWSGYFQPTAPEDVAADDEEWDDDAVWGGLIATEPSPGNAEDQDH